MQLRSMAHGGLALLLVLTITGWTQAQPDKDKEPDKEPKKEAKKEIKRSVSINDAKAYKGYTLIAPMSSKKTYLLDMEGRICHTWETDCTPALIPYLLDNGNLLRPGQAPKGLGTPGFGGRLQEMSWDGKLLWDYTFDSKNQHPHHDVTRLPNGNVLMIISDRKSAKEAILAGRRPEMVRDVLNSDAIIEVKQTGPTTGEVVWEWHAWDHLVQEQDKDKANFGKVAASPGRIDLNYTQGLFGFGRKPLKKEELDKLKDLGYLGGPGAKGGNLSADWTHFNGIAYNADLDQIMISVHSFSEVWIIDHSTTKDEAKGISGGKSGKGGDILYRWGNPQAYRSGTNADQRLFKQHNAHWIAKGLPGAGNMMVFNNGNGRMDGTYSTVDEIVLPINKDGSYDRKPNQPFGPTRAEWSYSAPTKSEFYAFFISGAHRLPNGNTLICSGPDGTVFEVTPKKEVVWKFVNPNKGGFGGGPGGFIVARPGQVLPVASEKTLKIEPEQKKQIDELQKDVDAKLDKIMTDEQKAEWKKAREGPGGFGPKGPGGPPKLGQLVPAPLELVLKTTPEQKKEIAELQSDVEARLDKIMTDEQKQEWKKIRETPPPKMGGGPGPGGGGPGGMGGLFRSTRFGPDHPALKGRDLTPGKRIEDL
jgi:Arylsulfotransferase (ASST)